MNKNKQSNMFVLFKRILIIIFIISLVIFFSNIIAQLLDSYGECHNFVYIPIILVVMIIAWKIIYYFM
jgi:hypothetical protein